MSGRSRGCAAPLTVALIVLLAGCSAAAPRPAGPSGSSGPSAPSASSAPSVAPALARATRLVAQEGLAIALASKAQGALGALSIASPDSTHLALQGASATPSDSAATGRADAFSLFPPTPIGSNVAQSAGDVHFDISVVDDTTRTLTGSVRRISTGEALADIAVDRTGTGTIRYVGQPAAVPVVSWTLTG